MSTSYQCTIDQIGTNPACPPFTADTLAHAQAAAQAVSNALARTVYLIPGPSNNAMSPPWTAYTAGSPLAGIGY